MRRILLVEDNHTMRHLLSEALREGGCDVVPVAGGLEGLRALQAKKFDALVSDIVMPDMDGLELIRFARRNFPRLRIVAITAGTYTLDSDLLLRAATVAGADVTLRKPFEMEELIAAVAGESATICSGSEDESQS
jgi:CheY-like chemotaxis protein